MSGVALPASSWTHTHDTLTSASLFGPPHLRNFLRLTKCPPSFKRTLCCSQASLAKVPRKVLPDADICECKQDMHQLSQHLLDVHAAYAVTPFQKGAVDPSCSVQLCECLEHTMSQVRSVDVTVTAQMHPGWHVKLHMSCTTFSVPYETFIHVH